MIAIFQLLSFLSVVILFFKVQKNGLNLLRFNFGIYIIISLVPFAILYEDFNSFVTTYYFFKLLFTIIFLAMIVLDNTRIRFLIYTKFDLFIIKVIAIISVTVIVIFILLIGVQNFPLFNVLSGVYLDLIIMREDAYKNADIPVTLFYLVFYVKYFFIPLYASAVMIYWNKLNKKLTIIILVIMAVNQLLTLSKTGLFLMILALIMTKLFTSRISIKKILVSFSLITLVPVMILYLITLDREIIPLLEAIGNRVFLIPEASALEYFQIFNEGGFRDYTSSTLFGFFNGDEVINIQNYVFLKMHPDSIIESGTAPGNIFGIVYVDFNIYLIPIYHIFILVFMYWLNRVLISHNSYLIVSLLVSSSMAMSFIYFTNFPTVVNSYGIIFAIFILYILKRKKRNQYRIQI